MTFPWIDLLFLLLALVGAAGGWRRGALRIAVGAAGAFTGLVLAVLLIRLVPTGPQLHPAVTLLAGLAGAGIGAALVHPAGRLLTRAAHALGLGLMDRAGGLLLGGVGALVAGWLLLLAAVAGGGLPPAGTALADSRVATALSARLPAVPVLANRLQLPAAVTGLLPSSHPNRLDVPTGSQAVAARVAASTALVTGSNCTGGTLGSGVVVAPRRVATAAHVVAGMTAPTVSTPGGGTLRASVVSYNPAADLAVLAVPDLTAPPIPLRSGYLRNGSPVVVLGHPAGGPLVARPGLVQLRTPTAIVLPGLHGIDETYLLTAAIAPGSSGGPVVDSSGRLAALVQGVSAALPDRAFALTLPPLAGQLTAGIKTQLPVSTGSCPTTPGRT